MRLNWQTKPNDVAVEFCLIEKPLIGRRRKVPIEGWHGIDDPQFVPGIRRLAALVDEGFATASNDTIALPHKIVAGLGQLAASQVGLPPLIPFSFELKSLKQ